MFRTARVKSPKNWRTNVTSVESRSPVKLVFLSMKDMIILLSGTRKNGGSE